MSKTERKLKRQNQALAGLRQKLRLPKKWSRHQELHERGRFETPSKTHSKVNN